MKPFENLDVEFKEIYVADIKKEVIAFANSEGGAVYVGIRGDGQVIGVENPDDVMLRAAAALKDAVRPDIIPFVQIKAVQMEGKPVVEITVQPGTARPYYLHDKGLKPSGVYVRKGSASLPASDEAIREMIVSTSGKSYENCRSMEQELTFHALEGEFAARSIEFGPAQMKTLHLTGEDGLYTNLARLLSDQCGHTIKTAIFQGSDKAVFRSRHEFSGSLLKQLREVYQLIDLNNKTKATFHGLNRTDKRDYPEEAVREALLNCIVHRDYSFSGSTLINIYDDRMEFVSLGGLVPGLSTEAIFMGVSQSRNPNLAAVFYRMRLIESCGTGIGKIVRLYRDEPQKPQFDTAQGAFRVILPNCNEMPALEGTAPQLLQETPAPYYASRPQTPPAYQAPSLPSQEKELICAFARQHGSVTRKAAEALLDAKPTKTYTLIKQLCEEGKLRQVGSGRNSVYVVGTNETGA